MKFNKHYGLEGTHAFLSASKYHWLNYDEEKLVETYSKHKAAQLGTELHELARHLIELGVTLPRNNKTLNRYVNDAIGFKMTPEVMLYHSPYCFGTADAISYNRGLLRVHDLKTGVTPASFNQLYIYAGIFSLEYDVPPERLQAELRLYQNDDVSIEVADRDKLSYVVEKILVFDEVLKDLESE